MVTQDGPATHTCAYAHTASTTNGIAISPASTDGPLILTLTDWMACGQAPTSESCTALTIIDVRLQHTSHVRVCMAYHYLGQMHAHTLQKSRIITVDYGYCGAVPMFYCNTGTC